jgi:hypothetical protein
LTELVALIPASARTVALPEFPSAILPAEEDPAQFLVNDVLRLLS